MEGFAKRVYGAGVATMPTYCLVPPDLADELQDLLRSHFRPDRIVVVVDRRWPERRASEGPSGDSTVLDVADPQPSTDHGHRPGTKQRATLVNVDPPALPHEAQRHASRLRFVQPAWISAKRTAARDTPRLVLRAQEGDPDAFGALYLHYFDRVYSYLRMNLNDRHEAEDIAQQVFLNAFDRLDCQPATFRVWLFRIARNLLIDHLKKHRPTLLEDPDQQSDRYRANPADPANADMVQSTLAWMSESDVALLIRRLPMAQRQVIILRYLIGLTFDEIADVLSRDSRSIEGLDYRGRQYLRNRLIALGREPAVRRRAGIAAKHHPLRVLQQRRFVLLRGFASSRR